MRPSLLIAAAALSVNTGCSHILVNGIPIPIFDGEKLEEISQTPERVRETIVNSPHDDVMEQENGFEGYIGTDPNNTAITYWDEHTDIENIDGIDCSFQPLRDKTTGEILGVFPSNITQYIQEVDDEGAKICTDNGRRDI